MVSTIRTFVSKGEERRFNALTAEKSKGPRQKLPSLDIHGAWCVHVDVHPVTREHTPCTLPAIQTDTRHGWLCQRHYR